MTNGDYSSLTDRELLLVVSRDVRDMRADIAGIKQAMTRYPTRNEIEAQLERERERAHSEREALQRRVIMLERIVFAAVGLILVTVFGAIVTLVVTGGGV